SVQRSLPPAFFDQNYLHFAVLNTRQSKLIGVDSAVDSAQASPSPAFENIAAIVAAQVNSEFAARQGFWQPFTEEQGVVLLVSREVQREELGWYAYSVVMTILFLPILVASIGGATLAAASSIFFSMTGINAHRVALGARDIAMDIFDRYNE
ncbi:hypothetical protein ACFWTE_07055, partial [Nocardiopsis sp. NPDC058631]|uniref:hypothetical protein n=1 Tax=Nocardiopsis sp. NPDC058631 TaxID=3346566 RepID=UPI00365F56B2